MQPWTFHGTTGPQQMQTSLILLICVQKKEHQKLGLMYESLITRKFTINRPSGVAYSSFTQLLYFQGFMEHKKLSLYRNST